MKPGQTDAERTHELLEMILSELKNDIMDMNIDLNKPGLYMVLVEGGYGASAMLTPESAFTSEAIKISLHQMMTLIENEKRDNEEGLSIHG